MHLLYINGMNRVADIPLAPFADPIRVALNRYAEETDDRVAFDIDAAAELVHTPEKPNYARSSTPVKHLGEIAGNLVVIVFAPEDGTGDESTYKLTYQMRNGLYPTSTKLVPRSKASIHSEAHLTIASQFVGEPDTDPTLFCGNLDMIGFRTTAFRAEPYLSRQADLGHSRSAVVSAMQFGMQLKPAVTLTTGYHASNGERFGDPHAVFNADPFLVQVCGFIAVSEENAAHHAALLPTLGAVEPKLLF